MAIENPPAFPPSITTNASGAAPERTIAQFFFEVGYAACYADAYIRNDGKPPFELSDALIERAWEIAAEAHEDPAEWDAYQAKADAAPDLIEALRPFVKEFEERREAYIRRYPRNPGVGARNFDDMPDEWEMENSTFSMGTYRRARTALRKALGEGEA